MSQSRRLRIVAVGQAEVPVELASTLAARLRDRVRIAVKVDGSSFRRVAGDGAAAGTTGDRGRLGKPEETGPISSNALVDSLATEYPVPDGGWTLGLTAHDLVAPGRPYVFGEATMGGRWAVVSVARLGPPGKASPRLIERLCKEALHEIGHLSGLEHCAAAEGCVMCVSETVAAIDAKAADFCGRCKEAFLQNEG